MAITATRLLQPRITGITKSVRPKAQESRGIQQNVPTEAGMVIRISISDLIEQLNKIAEEKNVKSIGFRPQKLSDDFDLLVAKKAKSLGTNLVLKPDKYSVRDAMIFLGSYEIIEGLVKLKTRFELKTLGFRQEVIPKEDEILVKNLELLASELLNKPGDGIVNIAVDFIETVNVIIELERISAKSDKLPEMGFHSIGVKNHPAKEKLGERAKELATLLKIAPTQENKALALDLLELVQKERLLENERLKENQCFGLHCVLDEDDSINPELN